MAKDQVQFGNYIARLLADDPTLKELDLSFQELTDQAPTDEDIGELVNVIQHNTSITGLNLRRNNLDKLSENAFGALYSYQIELGL